MVMLMDYDFKANLTTILSTYLIPILVGYGFSAETSNALVGVIVALVIIGFGMLNERYTSDHLTKVDDSEDMDDSDEDSEEDSDGEDIENAYRDSEIA